MVVVSGAALPPRWRGRVITIVSGRTTDPDLTGARNAGDRRSGLRADAKPRRPRASRPARIPARACAPVPDEMQRRLGVVRGEGDKSFARVEH